MRIRAVIFDIYNTLLEIGLPPVNPETSWIKLCRNTLGGRPRLTLREFATACQEVIAREHAAARKVGILQPEVFWPAVVGEAFPELESLTPNQLEVFLIEHAALQRSVRLMPRAAGVLRALRRKKILLGLASNSQPYTLVELDASLAAARLRRGIFKPEVSLLSFEAGFSKPDPHVFRWLAARLRCKNIRPIETLIVGDRLDNDTEPAHAQGFQTWHLTTKKSGWINAGDWQALWRFLQPRL